MNYLAVLGVGIFEFLFMPVTTNRCIRNGEAERYGRKWWEAGVLEDREKRETQNANSL